ncbi:MAG: hypothetical protein AB1700_18365, partial [Bacillota bacterium]
MTGNGARNARQATSARKRRRRWLIPVAVLVLCAAGIAGYASYRGLFSRRATVTSQELYQLVPVENGSITLKVTASGTVRPGSTYQVAPKVGGTITEVLVKQGD